MKKTACRRKIQNISLQDTRHLLLARCTGTWPVKPSESVGGSAAWHVRQREREEGLVASAQSPVQRRPLLRADRIDDLRPSEGLHGLIQQRAPRLQQRRIPGVSVAKPRLAVAEDECQLRPLRLLESLLLPTSAVVDSADSATAITDIFCSARGPGT